MRLFAGGKRMGGKGMVGHPLILGITRVRTTLIGKEFELMLRRKRVRRNGRPVPVSRWKE